MPHSQPLIPTRRAGRGSLGLRREPPLQRPMRLLSLLAAGALSLPIAAASQGSLPMAPGAHVVTVSPLGKEEPTIAVNPKNPSQVVAAFQFPADVAYSQDSGRTFAPSSGTATPEWKGGTGDVVLTFDAHGVAYLCNIGFDSQGSEYYWGHGSGRSAVMVRRSLDGGKTWEPKGVAVNMPPVTANTPFQDQARIFADIGPKSPYVGNLYIGWIEWRLDSSVILFSRSTDGAKTWSPAMRISTQAGLPRDGNGDVVGFTGTVGSNGTIYATWDRGHEIQFTTSRDGGRTFAPSRSIIETGPPYMGAIPDLGPVFGAMGMPGVGVDPHGAAIYVSWSDYTNGDIDVFFSRSTNGGRTWSPPMRVNSDPVHNGADQFFQWMAVDPITGAIYLQFYDRRDDPRDRKTGVTLARSTDGGRTFTNYAWTSAAFDGHDVRLGDYMWLTAYDNRVYGVWAEAVQAETPGMATSAVPNVVAEQAAQKYLPVIKVGTADFSNR